MFLVHLRSPICSSLFFLKLRCFSTENGKETSLADFLGWDDIKVPKRPGDIIIVRLALNLSPPGKPYSVETDHCDNQASFSLPEE